MTAIGTLRPFDPATEDFDAWNEVFESFLVANGLDQTDSKDLPKCRAILISNIGIATYTLLTNLVSPVAPKDKDLRDLVLVLKQHFKPAPTAIAERFRFTSRRQKVGESVATFLAELRKLAVTCSFATNLEERLRDQFIFGLLSEQAQKRLFTEADDVKLHKVLNLALAQETAEASTSLVRDGAISKGTPDQVNKTLNNTRNQQQFNKKPQQQSQKPFTPPKQGNNNNKGCPNCGSKDHVRAKDGPHKEVKCFSFGKVGHFSRYCRSSKKKQFANANAISSSNTVDVVKQVRTDTTGHFTVQVFVNGVSHIMELDTGCKRSILSEDFWKSSLESPSLQQSKQVFLTYTNQQFRPRGDLQVNLQYESLRKNYTFCVAKGTSLFGRDLISLFGLDINMIQPNCHQVSTAQPPLSLKSLLSEYSDIFGPINGPIKNYRAKVILKDDAVPKFLKARPIPFALREKVNRQLDHMETTGAITRIEHSEWASPIVVAPRSNGKVRVTADFKHTVNSQLNVTQYPLQRIDELFHAVSNGEKYSRLDGPDAFHQIELDEASKKFLVINTHRGLYRYNVLPQGVASGPAIFQEFMDKLLNNIPKCGSFIDDILCTGSKDEDHLQYLRRIFQRMPEANFRLDKGKCSFMKDSQEYVGHVISKQGLHTSPSKVNDLLCIQKPLNVTEVKSFLGIVNFYCKFVPNISEICEPHYSLTRKDVPFKWSQKCQSAFEHVKSCLSSSQVLTHHDPRLPIGISCDASSKGLGVVLFHRYQDNSERPIAFASKLLSPAEKKYSQIEKEALSIVFGVKKFFQYLCGREFSIVTDHKPLLSILGPRQQVPSFTATRLQKWSLYLSQFLYDISYHKTV